MTATIEATGYTLNAQNQYVRSGFAGERYITLNILGACTIGGGCALCVVRCANAAAQQTSVDYSASPSGLVSVNADGQLVVLPQANAGLMTATIEATGYTLNAQNQYVRSGFAAERYIWTLK